MRKGGNDHLHVHRNEQSMDIILHLQCRPPVVSAVLLLDLKCGDGVSISSDSSVLWLLYRAEGGGAWGGWFGFL